MDKQTEKNKNSKLIQFLGGQTSYYVLGLLALGALTIFLFRKIDFLFQPIFVIFTAILPPVIFAIILYYLLNPLVKLVAKTKLSRTWSTGVIYILLIGLLVLGGVLLFPTLQAQTRELIDSLPDFVTSLQKNVESLISQTPLAAEFQKFSASLNELTTNSMKFISDYWEQGAAGIGSVFSFVSTTAITLVTGPIIAFFLLKNPEAFYRNILSLCPPAFRKDGKELIKTADEQLGAFLKGQVIASLIIGVFYWIAFLLIRLDFASVLAIAIGFLSIIPYIGTFLAFLPALFVAAQDSNFMVIKFVIVWFAIQTVHGDLVVPRVMGNRLKIHPITILIVLLVMGDLFGFMGLIFGIPIYTLVKILVVFTFRKFKGRYNRFYGETGLYEKDTFTKEEYLDEDN